MADATKDLDQQDTEYRESMQGDDPSAQEWRRTDASARAQEKSLAERTGALSIYGELNEAREARESVLNERDEGVADEQDWWERYGEADDVVAQKGSAWQKALDGLGLDDLDQLKDDIARRQEELQETLDTREEGGQLPSEENERLEAFAQQAGDATQEMYGGREEHDEEVASSTVDAAAAAMVARAHSLKPDQFIEEGEAAMPDQTVRMDVDADSDSQRIEEERLEQARREEEQRNADQQAEEDRLADEQDVTMPEAEEGMEIDRQDVQSWQDQRREVQDQEEEQGEEQGHASGMGHGPGGLAWGAAETMEDREEFRNLERVQGDLEHELGERANHDQVVAREQEEAEAVAQDPEQEADQQAEEAGVAMPTLDDWRDQRTQASEESEAQEEVQDVQATDQQEGEAQGDEDGVSVPTLNAWRKQREQGDGAQDGGDDTPPEQRVNSTVAQRQAEAQAQAEQAQDNQVGQAEENTQEQGQGRRNDFGQGM